MSDPSRYTVGWICALSLEHFAARQFLDEIHDRPSHFSANDSNTYTLGKMAGHNVVIAVLPDGEYGISSAAGVATDMLASFPNIRIGLLVGIGGGVPSQKHDIRLGDVVVSSPQGGTGGVYQYDYGKAIQGRAFEQTGFLNQPPIVVRTAVSSLREEYKYDGHKIDQNIGAVLDRKPRMKKTYSRPAQTTDRLYKANVRHPYDQEGGCEELCGLSSSDLVQRSNRSEDEDDVAIHYGVIASGNALMKDAGLRDALAAEKDVLCFEMEAAGLMNRFPCLVIRGICDYSDSHKNKEWQGYAAMTAAAYARGLLQKMVPSRVESESKLGEALDSILHKLDTVYNTNEKVHANVGNIQMQEQTKRIRKWLSAPDPSRNHNAASAKRHEGTGLWFTDSDTFKKWKSDSKSVLWLHGKPGCGKTVLSSTIIEALQQNTTTNTVLLYFYFDFNDKDKQSLDKMLRSLIEQFYQQEPDVRPLVNSLWTSHVEGGRQPPVESLASVLGNMLRKASDVSIVLDALDESSKPRDDLLAWMNNLMIPTESMPEPTVCRLLVTSRREEDNEAAFHEWTLSSNMVGIEETDVDGDISIYIKQRVQSGEEFKRWQEMPEVREEIETKLMEKADGMFRWVACQIDALKSCKDYLKLSDALGNLPDTLDETYERILKAIPRHDLDQAVTVLRLLTWSDRPIRLEEMRDAIAVRTDKQPGFDTKHRMPVPRDILTLCSSLVVLSSAKNNGKAQVREEKLRLRLAHFSVKEYLLSDRNTRSISSKIGEKESKTHLAKICLIYLEHVDHGLSIPSISRKFPFSQYSAENWISYAREANTEEESLRKLLLAFFLKKTKLFPVIFSLYDPENQYVRPGERKKDMAGGLYYASLGGLQRAVSDLIDTGADVNARGGLFGTALQAASRNGHEKIVQILLDADADVNAKAKHSRGDTALLVASFKGYEKIVQMLLEKDAEVNVEAIEAASRQGHEKIVLMLLEASVEVDVNVNAIDKASSRGHQDIVQGHFEASSRPRYWKIERLLLEAGAEVTAEAIEVTSLRKHDIIMQMLREWKGNDNGRLHRNKLPSGRSRSPTGSQHLAKRRRL